MGDSLTGGLLVALIAYKRSVSDQLYTPWYRVTSTGGLSARFIFFQQAFYFLIHVYGLLSHEVVNQFFRLGL